MKTILVLGSLNKDLVSFVEKNPLPGETISGLTFEKFNGGKGANQAVAISKLGAPTYMMGAIGNDTFGKELLESLKQSKVDTNHIVIKKDNSGLAIITVDKSSENSIIVHGGANDLLSKEDLNNNLEAFKKCNIFVTQLENKAETVLYAMKIAKKQNLKTVLTPAPSAKYIKEMINYTDFIILNEHEFKDVFQFEATKENIISCINRHQNLTIIVTLGSKGVMYNTGLEVFLQEAFKVDAVDTTAAGDTFVGGFVSKLAQDLQIEEAIEYGQKAASISVTRKGAQSSMPTKKEVDQKQ